MATPSLRSDASDTFECLRQNIFTLYKVAQQGEKRKKFQWRDDKTVLEEYIGALTRTREVMRDEEKRVSDRLSAEVASRESETATEEASENEAKNNKDCADSKREELRRLKERMADVEKEVAEVRCQLNEGFKGVEMEIWETKLAVLQDIRRLCSDEVKHIEEGLARDARAETKRRAQEIGVAELTSLRDQVARVEAKLDAAKRSFYFPSADGYRFRAGGSGVFVGAKDLHISDVSGSFFLSAAGVHSKSKKENLGRFRLHVGGTTRSEDSSTPGSSVSLRTPSISLKHPATPPPTITTPIQPTSDKQPSEPSPKPPPTPSVQKRELSSSNSASNAGKSAEGHVEVEVSSTRQAKSVSEKSRWTSALPQLDGSASRAKRVAVKLLNRRVSKDKSRWVPSRSRTKDQGEGVQSESRTGLVKRIIQVKRKGGESLKTQFSSRLKSQMHEWDGSDLQPSNRISTDPGIAENRDAAEQASSDQDAAPNAIAPNEVVRSAGSVAGSEPPGIRDEPNEIVNGSTHGSEAFGSLDDSELDPVADQINATPQNAEQEVEISDVDIKLKPSATVESDGLSERTDREVENSSRASGGRKGVYVKVKAGDLELVGEKGSRVPNLLVKEILLEVECMVSVDVRYSAASGWQIQGGIAFEILKLKKKVSGNSLPLPLTLVKTVLNMVLPKVVERLLASNLPVEFGEYILESGSNCMLNGEITIVGPPLSAFQAGLASRPIPTSGSAKARAESLKDSLAGKEARGMLGLTNTDARLLEEAFKGRDSSRLSEVPLRCTISALCEFRRKFGASETWDSLCSLWDKALKSLALLKGWDSALDFVRLMNGVVSDLARKPMRGRVVLTRLNCNLNIGAMLTAFRDYMERSAKELDAAPPDALAGPVAPLEEQLEALELWHRQWIAKLNLFESKFKTATCSLVANADSQSLDVGLDQLHYEGPLSIKLPVSSQEDGMLSYELSIPVGLSKAQSSSVFDAFKQAMAALKKYARSEYEKKNPTKLDAESNEVESEKLLLPIGRLFAHRVSMGLCLNETDLAKMLLGNAEDPSSAATTLSPIGLQQMLGCLGDLLSCTLGPSDQRFSDAPYSFSLTTNELARCRADVETVGFQSLVSPATLVRMIHSFMHEVLEGVSTNTAENHRRLAKMDSMFHEIVTYTNKRALDVGVCATVTAKIKNDHLFVSLQEMPDSDGGICAPLHVVNDVDLMAVMETLNLGSQTITTMH